MRTNNKAIGRTVALWIVLLLPYVGAVFVWQHFMHEERQLKEATFAVISKSDLTITVFDYQGMEIARYPVAVGKNYGNKESKGDMRTPEGTFHVVDIQDAATWPHDFKDGNGVIEGAYGPCFIRLLTPGHAGIGIHGTHDPASIGTRATEGCIRLKNEDVEKLREQLSIGSVVVITPSKEDAVASLAQSKVEMPKQAEKEQAGQNQSKEELGSNGKNKGTEVAKANNDKSTAASGSQTEQRDRKPDASKDEKSNQGVKRTRDKKAAESADVQGSPSVPNI